MHKNHLNEKTLKAEAENIARNIQRLIPIPGKSHLDRSYLSNMPLPLFSIPASDF